MDFQEPSRRRFCYGKGDETEEVTRDDVDDDVVCDVLWGTKEPNLGTL